MRRQNKDNEATRSSSSTPRAAPASRPRIYQWEEKNGESIGSTLTRSCFNHVGFVALLSCCAFNRGRCGCGGPRLVTCCYTHPSVSSEVSTNRPELPQWKTRYKPSAASNATTCTHTRLHTANGADVVRKKQKQTLSVYFVSQPRKKKNVTVN